MPGYGKENFQPSSYVLKKVELFSDKLIDGASVRLERVVSDIDIYEHIEKSYLTGYITLLDNAGLFDRIDITGGERIEISFKRPDSYSKEISKMFTIQNIETSAKVSDQADIIMFAIVEDIAFTSVSLNVNRSYSGKPFTIIDNILNEYLDRTLMEENITNQNKIKLIVPNMSPLAACEWVKARAVSTDGLPFYLFSTLVGDRLHFIDLGSLLTDNSPFRFPYTYSLSMSDYQSSNNQMTESFNILKYDYKNTEDLMQLINLGNVGARHGFYDTFTMKMRDMNFNVNEDVFKPLVNKNQLKPGQQAYIYSDELKVKGLPLHEIESETITSIGSSGIYYNGTSTDTGLDEEGSTEDYKKRVKAEAIRNFTLKSPITIIVPCMNFIEGIEHLTVGRIINLQFISNFIGSDNEPNISIDRKKSGEYLIFSARHMMKKEQYNIGFSCIKLANLPENL
tara:strand:- start:143 stop:1501 length:1359 start_codon:yes stop_codon:yes gene_type:complete